MSDEAKVNLINNAILLFGGNVTIYVINHYHDILGATLSFLSMCYLLWKWRKEYLKDKPKKL